MRAQIGRPWEDGRDSLLGADSALREEYDRLGPRYAVIREIVKHRSRAKMTQAELAAKMGVTQGVVSRLESGEHSPKLETLNKAAKALGCRVDVRFVKDRAAETSPLAPVAPNHQA